MTQTSSAINANKEAVEAIFSILDEQGRMRKWLATRLGISKSALWNYERGIRAMPQDVFDRACKILNAPSSIASTQIPVSRPGRKSFSQKSSAKKGA